MLKYKQKFFLYAFICFLNFSFQTDVNGFEKHLSDLARNPKQNATEIWRYVYDNPQAAAEIERKIVEAYATKPLITEYGNIEDRNIAHVTLGFKCQGRKSGIEPGDIHIGAFNDHAGLILEFFERDQLKVFYYDLATSDTSSGEDSNQVVSGVISTYKVRCLDRTFIISKFLWAKIAPHYEVGYYTHKTFLVELSKLKTLKERLDKDVLKETFPYSWWGKWNHNCITYVGQALQDAGIIEQKFCVVYYDADWLREIANSAAGKKVEEGRYRRSKKRENELFVFSEKMQERVIMALLENAYKSSSSSYNRRYHRVIRLTFDEYEAAIAALNQVD